MKEAEAKNAIIKNLHSRLGTLPTARDALAEILDAYAQNAISERNGRTFGYMFGVLLNYLRAESDAQIEERLTELERRFTEATK